MSLCISFAAFGQQRDQYREVDLSQLGHATLFAINERGVIAAANDQGSFLYDSRSGQVLFHFPTGDTVTALSDNGNAAGHSTTGSAWFERDGVIQAIPLSQALGVNNDGMVAGFAGGFFVQAGVYSTADGSSTTISLGGTQGAAFAINSSGQVAGQTTLQGGSTSHAFLWSDGVVQDLGTLGGDSSTAFAIDNGGRVTGKAALSFEEAHAFLFNSSGMHDLGTLPGCTRSEGSALHGRLIVGDSDSCSFAGSHAFISDGVRMTDLNDVAQSPDGFVYATARGINGSGSIIGIATAPDGGSTRPFLLVRSNDGQ